MLISDISGISANSTLSTECHSFANYMLICAVSDNSIAGVNIC